MSKDEVLYDSHGRIQFGGAMKLEFSSQILELPPREEHLEMLRDDCKKAFQLKECEEGERYSEGQTFWMPATATPRCELERLAQGIFAHHTRHARFDPSTSGAEWWTQHIDTIDDIGFHFDRDYGLEEDGELCHPLLGTVTYLSEVGGATVILDMPGRNYPTSGSDGAVNCPLQSCVLSRPAVGKHITFDGLHLHGAPADLYEEETTSSSSEDDEDEDESDEEGDSKRPSRVTFLVNIWLNHVPTQAVPLDDDLAAVMGTPRTGSDGAACPVIFSQDPPSAVQTMVLSAQDDLHSARWALQVQEQDCVIELCLPAQQQLEAPFVAGAHTVILQQSEGGARVRSTRLLASCHPVASSSSSSSNGSSNDRKPIDDEELALRDRKKPRL
mmetsp:Transcript_18463/g.30772  ORF Transcript_18463/g.30772 Transcript_18463/m.30772 type:complete len:386 (+) Transcript_18463:134-1291(+)